MSHVVLLGDSVFDNAAYVGGGPEVVSQLGERLPSGWRATLRAVDGSVIASVREQLGRLPDDATHLVVSAGGNDALGHLDLLGRGVRSMAEALAELAAVGHGFERDYRWMLEGVSGKGLPVAVCAVYYPNFPEPGLQELAVTALSVFNDALLRAAFGAGLPVIDLRLICNEAGDYANPIEPSSQGGEKIAAAIVRLLAEHDFTRRRAEVFV